MFLGKGVLKICSNFTGEHPCRSAISIKLLCNFIEITLRHGFSPVNLLHIFRTPFLKNISGWLLLNVAQKSLRVWKKYKRSLFSSVQHCYMFLTKSSKMNCKVPHFCKISIIVYIFDRFLCQRRFLQDLLWVSVCSAKFLVGSGGFLLWFFQKRNTPTFIRNIATEQVLMIFLCAQT